MCIGTSYFNTAVLSRSSRIHITAVRRRSPTSTMDRGRMNTSTLDRVSRLASTAGDKESIDVSLAAIEWDIKLVDGGSYSKYVFYVCCLLRGARRYRLVTGRWGRPAKPWVQNTSRYPHPIPLTSCGLVTISSPSLSALVRDVNTDVRKLLAVTQGKEKTYAGTSNETPQGRAFLKKQLDGLMAEKAQYKEKKLALLQLQHLLPDLQEDAEYHEPAPGT